MRKATNGFKKPEATPASVTPRAYTPRQAADRLGVSLNHIKEELRAGKIPFRWVGKAGHSARVIDVKDLDAYFESLPKDGPKAPEMTPARLKFLRKLNRFNRRFAFGRAIAAQASDQQAPVENKKKVN